VVSFFAGFEQNITTNSPQVQMHKNSVHMKKS